MSSFIKHQNVNMPSYRQEHKHGGASQGMTHSKSTIENTVTTSTDSYLYKPETKTDVTMRQSPTVKSDLKAILNFCVCRALE